MNQRPESPARKVGDLKQLIGRAAAGDEDAARRLVAPFISSDERLVSFGLTAKFGLFATYDFAFLTDRRVGDLEITPMTGSLSVEIAWLHKIDALVLIQPAYPILLRLFGLLLVALPVAGVALAVAQAIIEPRYGPGALQLFLTILGAGLWVFLAGFAINPAIKRAFLRLTKSGLIVKLAGTSVATFIFADRDKFEMLTRLTREIAELKRQLDKEAA